MKKILIITYYWPPAGGPGVQRWLHFVRYLPKFGIQPLVLVPENPYYPIQDPTLVNEVPAGVEIIKIPTREPYKWAKILSKNQTQKMSSGILPDKKPGFLEKSLLFVRGNLFIPDARVGWVRPVTHFLQKYLTENQIDTLITTGPPHSLHLIGQSLKKKLKIRWIADFRDPWAAIGYHQKLMLTPWAQKQHHMLEAKVLQQADEIVVTSKLLKSQFEKLTPKPVSCITNGFEPPVEKTTVEPEKEQFVILHTGSLLTGRNTPALWEAIGKLSQKNPDFKQWLRIRLVGVVSNKIIDSIREAGLSDSLELLPYLSHREVLVEQKKAAVLLLAEIDTEATRLIIPGKLFEYFMAARPILAIGPKDWEVAQMLKTTQTGQYFPHNDPKGIQTHLEILFANHLKGANFVKPEGVEQYSRENLTNELAKRILDKNGHCH